MAGRKRYSRKKKGSGAAGFLLAIFLLVLGPPDFSPGSSSRRLAHPLKQLSM